MIALEPYIKQLAAEDEADRIYAAEDIGSTGQAEGVQPLLDRLPIESSRAVREAIFSAFLQIRSNSVILGMLGLLDSEDPFLRNEAVEVLRARDSKTIPFLVAAFRAGSSQRRKFVLDVLAKLGGSGPGEIYDLALCDPDINVVITAVENLGATRDIAFRSPIENLLSAAAEPMLLCACLQALAEIGNEDSVNAVRELLPGKKMPGYLKPSYLKLLGARGGPEGVEEVAGFLGQDGFEEYVLDALTCLQSRYPKLVLPIALLRPLQNVVSHSHSRLPAYQAVRLVGSFLPVEEAFAFVEICLVAAETPVRIAAVQALQELASSRALGILNDRLLEEKDEEVLQALARL